MDLLLTNDDGIRAPGIQALFHAIAPLADRLLVVAPLTVQSATSHGVTFDQPLMTRELTVGGPGQPGPGETPMPGVAVDGRPADCVKLALTNLWPERFGEGSRPDLVVSGMNMGANSGINVIYSGTVAAAVEAAFLGIPSIAVSLHLGRGEADYVAAAGHARSAIDRVLAGGPLDAHTCLNLNVPICDAADPGRHEPKDVVVCPMNVHGHMDKYDRRISPAGDVYYWPAGDGLAFHATDDGTDVAEMFAGRVTLTPLSYDLTHEATLATWRRRLGG